MTPIIEAWGVVKRFGSVRALDGLDLVVPPGEVVALLGPNGAGKTTLVRTLATLVRPDAGFVRVAGQDVVRQPARVRAAIGLAGQQAAVEPTMTGRENLRMVSRLYGLSRRDSRTRTDHVVRDLGLEEVADRPVKTYSGGQRRRVDLAASLVGRPQLLLLDEPTTGLDPRARIELWDAIRALARAGTDVLLTTQYLEEADQLAKRIVIVDHGQVIADGTPAELKSRVGRDVIDVHTRSADELPVVAAVLAAIGGEPTVDVPVHRASAPVAGGPAQLTAAVRALAEAAVTVEDISLRRPSLDEVFLTLTGATCAPTTTEEKAFA